MSIRYGSLTMAAVSVVIPAYNAAATVGRAIDSVLAQTFTDWELIAVDDGSTDATLAVLRSYADERITVLARSKASGSPATPRNDAMAVACGDWIAFLDADDEWLPAKLARQLNAAGDAELVYSRCRYRSATEDVDYHDRYDLTPFSGACADELIVADFVPCLTAMVRRYGAERIGDFAIGLGGIEDWHFWLRLALTGGTFTFVDEPLAVYHWHDSNMSQSGDWRDRELQMFRALAAEFPGNGQIRRRRTRLAWIRIRRRIERRVPLERVAKSVLRR